MLSRLPLLVLTRLFVALALPGAVEIDAGHAAADPGGPSLDTQLRLEALGYSEHATDDPDPSRRGVTRNDPDAMPGVSYDCTNATIRCLAMDGKLLHEVPLRVAASPGSGCLADLYRDREVLTVASPLLSMIRLGGELRWTQLGPCHHDVGTDSAGLLYALRRHDAVLARGGRTVPITGQSIDVLDAKGRRKRSIDLSPLLGPLVPDERVQQIADVTARRERVPKEEYA